MQSVIQFFKNKKIYLLAALTVIVIVGGAAAFLPTFFNGQPTSDSASTQVLGAQTTINPTVTLTPSSTPIPYVVPTSEPKISVPTNTPTPTAASATNTPSPTATPTPRQSAPSSPTDTPIPTSTPTPTVTPTPIADQVTIKAGTATWTSTLTAGDTAFDVIKRAVGDGLTYDSYDCCGAFITGFHGEHAVYPQWWEFFVNGTSSSVGVSTYHPTNGDVLEFEYHE